MTSETMEIYLITSLHKIFGVWEMNLFTQVPEL